MKTLAIGDLHTKAQIIDKVEKLIDNYDAVIFVGDYADDWNTSPLMTIAIWRRLKELQEKYGEKVTALIGNHDYSYILSFRPYSSGYNATTQMLLSTPENKELLSWLKDLPVTKELDGVVYSHAGIDISWNGSLDDNSLWADNSPLWTRPDDTDYTDTPQVFGHTPSKTCYEVAPNIWCIDTFSTYPDGTPVGDGTVLEITDGKTFNKIKLK